MIGRVPKHTSFGDDVDPGGLFVFIPGAIASGFLISVGLLIGDAFQRVRGTVGMDRRIQGAAAVVADECRDGAGAGRKTPYGLRKRWVYGVVSLFSLTLVALGVPGVTWNFLNPVGYIADIGWIWAISLLVVLAFGVLGVQSLRLAPEWLPFIVAALGLGLSVRFLLGSEPTGLRVVLVVSGLAIAVVGATATWRVRRRRRIVDVSPSVRPLLLRTPLARSE